MAIENPAGQPVQNFALNDCPEIPGDSIERTVTWENGEDVSQLSGKPVRIRFELKAADLYAFQFQSAN